MADFDARDLLDCYARGVFPMADDREDDRVFLIDPERRGVIPLTDFHVPRRLARTIRAEPFEIRADSAFHEVVLACAASGPGRLQTWINGPIERLYLQLHKLGFAHSLECWRGERLVGGLYGVSLNGAFFGESMFSLERDASKVALAHLVARLIAGGYRLLDAQFMTEHLAQFGAREISRRDYHRRLKDAMTVYGDFYAIGSLFGTGVDSGAGAGTGVGVTPAGASSGSGASTSGLGSGGFTAAGGGGGGALVLQLITQAS